VLSLFEEILSEGHPSCPSGFSHFVLFGTTAEIEVRPQAKCCEINLFRHPPFDPGCDMPQGMGVARFV
jgi:hypothetical protein